MMKEKKAQPGKQLSMSNTKKEMMDAYSALLEQIEERAAAELKPEKKIEEKKTREIIEKAEDISSKEIEKEISGLKMETGKMLARLAERLEEEVGKYRTLQQAIELRKKELEEIYDIEKSAHTLAALIETEHRKGLEFESMMASRKQELEDEILEMRGRWEKEEKGYRQERKEKKEEEEKRLKREREEYGYTFKREQQLARNTFEDEKAKQEKELLLKKEQVEKVLAEREKLVAGREEELAELRIKMERFPKELEGAVARAIKDTTAQIQAEAKNTEELMKREFDGERNVLTTRIESLVKRVEEQNEQIANLSTQLEKGYQKVQDIAEKAIEGSSNYRSVATLQQLVSEKSKQASQEK